MDDDCLMWLCYVKLPSCNPDENYSQGNYVYRSIPAKHWTHLLAYLWGDNSTYSTIQREDVTYLQKGDSTIIAVFKFHPINRCAIAEIDELEQIKTSSIKILMVGDKGFSYRLMAKIFFLRDFVGYYGFDRQTAMEIAGNNLVDIIMIDFKTIHSGQYNGREVKEMISMLKSNPKTAQIPVVIRLCGQVMVDDRAKYRDESGADNVVRFIHEHEDFVNQIKRNLI
ncbi:MAG: hypothetical protein ACM37W_27155 [Actinomycetota bacterium]